MALHASDSGYQDYLNTWEGNRRRVRRVPAPDVRGTWPTAGDRSRMPSRPRSATGCSPGSRACKLISVENGGSWVGTLLTNLEATYKKMPQEFPEHPVEVFRRNVWINPFWEDSVTGLIDLIGADRVCFGSDYPHPEGLEHPLDWTDRARRHERGRRREDHVLQHVRPDGRRQAGLGSLTSSGDRRTGFRAA